MGIIPEGGAFAKNIFNFLSAQFLFAFTRLRSLAGIAGLLSLYFGFFA